MTKNPIYLFFHLAKTGGTTFVGHLYETMTFDEQFVDLGPPGNNYRRNHNRLPLIERTDVEKDAIKAVVGHLVYWETIDLFPNREHRMIIFLREPVSRVLSHYTFDSSKVEETFTEWYSRWILNQTYAFLCDHLRASTLDEVLNKLEAFWHIGFTESLNQSLNVIYPALGVSTVYKNRRVAGEPENTTKDLGYDKERVIKQTYQPTPQEKARVVKDHLLDTWLFHHVQMNTSNGRYIKPKDFNAQDIYEKLVPTVAPVLP